MKRGRTNSFDGNPSPFKKPKLRSSTTPPLPNVSMEDISQIGHGLCDDVIDLLQPTTATTTWKGGRDQNQDSFYVDNSYDSQKLKDILENTDFTSLRTLCLPTDESNIKNLNKSIFIVAVFDGHGPLGDLGSSLACSTIPIQIHEFCPAITLNQNYIYDAIIKAFKIAQNQLLEQARTKEQLEQEYGTTANIAVLWSGNNLTVANGILKKQDFPFISLTFVFKSGIAELCCIERKKMVCINYEKNNISDFK